MSKMIQIRHVPDALHRKLKARAAEQGMTMSGYLLKELKHSAAQPTLEELRSRLLKRPPVELPISAAELIRMDRDSR